ncbi:hypothetical protein PG988_005666 [Apiospora saccharicola]
MSGPKRNPYVLWDGKIHEEIIGAMMAVMRPTMAQYEEIHALTAEMGHTYTTSALSYRRITGVYRSLQASYIHYAA